MLTIYLTGQEEAWFFDGDVAALFRTVRVVGERIVFIEVSPGRLVNLAQVERIEEEDDAPEELTPPPGYQTVAPGTASPLPGVESCPHGFIKGTCEQCADPQQRATP